MVASRGLGGDGGGFAPAFEPLRCEALRDAASSRLRSSRIASRFSSKYSPMSCSTAWYSMPLPPAPEPNTSLVTCCTLVSFMVTDGAEETVAAPSTKRRPASLFPPSAGFTALAHSASRVCRQYRKKSSSSSSYPRLQNAQKTSTEACCPALRAASALHITSQAAFSARARTPYCRPHQFFTNAGNGSVRVASSSSSSGSAPAIASSSATSCA
mmetsp:Transcript_8967/g.37679  ORF Transcript_8967/g.37679 Transcript_8967/m.37679 type:complete len:213 (+) Transcript_8967:359-997(+)